MYPYFKNVRVNRNEKIKWNGVVAKLSFLISVYEFPLLLSYYLFNYYYYTLANTEISYFRYCDYKFDC